MALKNPRSVGAWEARSLALRMTEATSLQAALLRLPRPFSKPCASHLVSAAGVAFRPASGEGSGLSWPGRGMGLGTSMTAGIRGGSRWGWAFTYRGGGAEAHAPSEAP